MHRRTGVWVVVVMLCLGTAYPSYAHADTIQSSNFKLDESSVGTSGPVGSHSLNYGITDATGDIGVGNSASSTLQINAGSKTTGDPALSFSVNSSNTTFGDFSPTGTSTGTATFSVLNYTTYGYVVQIVGPPPTNGSHVIQPMGTLANSQVGIEQFGINLVANTSPTTLGANPDNGQFGYGSVTSNYNTANKYYYQNGDIIAQATKDSGITNYTISFIVNVAPITHGGTYTADQTLDVTGTY